MSSEAKRAAADVQGVAAAVDHPAEPVERRVRVGAAHRLVQCRDLVVEVVPALVEPAQTLARDLLEDIAGDPPVALALREIRGDFEQQQGTPRIAVGRAGETIAIVFVHCDSAAGKATFFILQRAIDHAADVIRRQGLEDVRAHAREQCVIQFERWILGGRADEEDRPVLDVRQEGILLRLVETVHLIDEEHRRTAIVLSYLAGAVYGCPDILDAGQDGRHGDELGAAARGDHAGQGGLAGAGRAPEDHRVQTVMLDRLAQRAAGTEDVLLTGEFIEIARAHAIGQRPVIRAVGRSRLISGTGIQQRALAVPGHISRPRRSRRRRARSHRRPRAD